MSLRLKLAFSGCLLLAMALGIVTYQWLGSLREHFDSQQKIRVLQLQPLLNSALAVPLLQRDYASVQAILEESLQDPALQELLAYDMEDRLVASSRRSEGTNALDTEALSSDFHSNLALAGQKIGSLSFKLSNQDLLLAQKRITTYVLSTGVLALLFFSTMLWILSGSITRRLQQLVNATQSIQRGNYSPALPAVSSDEVGSLVRAFSSMSNEIDLKVSELNTLNQELELRVEKRTNELKQRTIELDQSVRTLETKTFLLNSAPLAFLTLEANTSDFKIIDATDALFNLLGYETLEVLERGIDCLEPHDSPGILVRQLRTVLNEEDSLEWEAGLFDKNGQIRWMRCLAFPFHENSIDGPRLALCLVDIHDIWIARQDQQKLAGALEESNKLQSIGLAIAGIAHDLNTPLGIAITGSTLLRDSLKPFLTSLEGGAVASAEVVVTAENVRKMHRATDLVVNNLEKAAALVKGLKNTSANASRKEWQKINLLSTIHSLLLTLSPLTRRSGCEIKVTCPTDLNLYSEPGSLGQVITNLVVNATLHAFDGQIDRVLNIEATRVEQRVVIRVADNGAGMSPEAIMRAFTPFFTTRRASGGSGLGLFSARRVVENVLGGTIEMQSAPNMGTEFIISLPIDMRSVQPPFAQDA